MHGQKNIKLCGTIVVFKKDVKGRGTVRHNHAKPRINIPYILLNCVVTNHRNVCFASFHLS